MRTSLKSTVPALMLLALLPLLSGFQCASLGSSLPGVPPPQIQPLAASARQPTTPSECLPTCSAALTVERGSWLNSPTPLSPPAASASAPTTP